MPPVRITEAATLAEASYAPQTIANPRVIASCPATDVEAHLLDGDILLLPGSNSVRDYLRFNLRPLNIGNRQLRMADDVTEKGDSGTIWHQGFLTYARVIFDWLAAIGRRPKFIIGHSLGAAAAQILSKSYSCPAIAFAAPRPKFVKGRVKDDDKCLIINRVDDLVPSLPSGFSHMGPEFAVTPIARSSFWRHRMSHYRAILGEAPTAALLGTHWPRS